MSHDNGGVTHHFQQPDPHDLVERPVGADEASVLVSGPQPPKPWWYLVGRQWPLFVTLVIVFVGVVVAAASYWRRGSTIIGGGLLVASVLRAVLPDKQAGLLTCRSRWFDVTFTTVLGLGILIFAWLVPASR